MYATVSCVEYAYIVVVCQVCLYYNVELLEAIIEESNSATTSPLSTPKSHVVQTPHLSSSPMSMEQQLSPFDDEFDEFDDMDTSETNEVVFGGKYLS